MSYVCSQRRRPGRSVLALLLLVPLIPLVPPVGELHAAEAPRNSAAPAAPAAPPAAAPSVAAKKDAGPQPLVISELAKGAKSADLAEDSLRAAIQSRPDPQLQLSFSSILARGSEYAVAWSACDRKACRGAVGLLKSGGADGKKLILGKQQALVTPPRVFMMNGVQIQSVALFDLDGDGQTELLVDYMVQEPPRPGVGSLSHQYYSFFSLPQLTPVWHFEVHRSGGAVEPVCDWDVAHGVSSQTGQPPEPLLTVSGGCKPDASAAVTGPATTKRFRWNKAGKRFLPAP